MVEFLTPYLKMPRATQVKILNQLVNWKVTESSRKHLSKIILPVCSRKLRWSGGKTDWCLNSGGVALLKVVTRAQKEKRAAVSTTFGRAPSLMIV